MAVAARHLHLVPAGHQRRPNLEGLLRLPDCPWWTAADAAELDILARALVKGVPWHLERCQVVTAALEETGYAWCKHLSAAVEEVLEWRDMREAYSRAVWLRAQTEAIR